jgi:hypothetical protein
LEAETANYWRFRHEYFRKGRPDLLSEIKRMNGNRSTPIVASESSKKTTGVVPTPVHSANIMSNVSVVEQVSKAEVLALKQRIEEMSNNMNQLTALVEKVKLTQDNKSPTADIEMMTAVSDVGSKRKKIDSVSRVKFAFDDSEPRPDLPISMDVSSVAALLPPLPLEGRDISTSSSVAMSKASDLSDNDFVEHLFAAFGEDTLDLTFDTNDALLPPIEITSNALGSGSDHSIQPGSRPLSPPPSISSDGPDPELMKRLGDSLMLLPREIQELIVDRLVKAITSNLALEYRASPVPTSLPVSPLPMTIDEESHDCHDSEIVAACATPEAVPPLAATTLAAMLRLYTCQLHEHGINNINHTIAKQMDKTKKSNHVPRKSIPVIPVHA